jgi:redox-sensitive bicupin YhaK (pirin superfamily)
MFRKSTRRPCDERGDAEPQEPRGPRTVQERPGDGQERDRGREPSANEEEIVAGAHIEVVDVEGGKPLAEPVAWHGPIVMNTQAEIRQALAELRDGSFLR